jgi:hypothetical protein
MLDYDHLHTMVSALRKKQIFFVGGTVRSGTTWLQLLLHAHPSVSCSGEGHFPDLLWHFLKQAMQQHNGVIEKHNEIVSKGADEIVSKGAEIYSSLEHDDVLHIFAFCIAVFLVRQSEHKPAALAIGDKTPANIRYLAPLAALFPNAKFIQIVRDGRDCAVSGWFLSQSRKVMDLGSVGPPNRKSLDTYASKFAAMWADDLARAQQVAEAHPNRFRRVRYEDLRADTEPILAELFGFLGVKTDPSVLSHCRREGSFTKLTGGRNPGEEDRLRFFRKGVAGDWRNYLSDEINRLFRERAGDWLDLLGYD